MTSHSPQVIDLDLGPHSYSIQVAHGLRHWFADYLKPWNQGQQWVVLSQQAILAKYQDVIDELNAAGYRIDCIVVPGDESAKNIRYAEQVWAQMVEMGCDRSSVLLAMGGGVVGDLGGFVAATYMRGIPFIQVPTTLLAMIDSAIGGKTAVNLAAGKNLVGAIYQPKTVLIDPGFLATLPRRNVISSLAEAIKYGFIIKAEIVSNDQFESGERKLLNYGHTIGHAFETIQEYGGLYHGEAVLYGMKCANFISHQKGLLSEAQYQQAQTVLHRFELPELGEVAPDRVLEVVSHDKKNINGKLNFILIDQIGNGLISTEVSEQDIVDSLSAVRA